MSSVERRPSRLKRAVLLVLLGVVLGLPAGYYASELLHDRGAAYVLVRELDITAAYAFAEDPPLRGVLEPGTEVRVSMKKGSVLYVNLRTAVDEKLFRQAAKRKND